MSFRAIYGHENQIDSLKRAMAKSRVAHAYLFYGTAGTGKKSTALAFAKALTCREPKGYDACDACLSCRKIERCNHPDIIVIDVEGKNIKIEDVRNIQNQMQFKPLEGEKRVVIICDADKMNITSANALLKTLEEPSDGNVLILITARFHQLPLTIISRCQLLRFNPLTAAIVSAYLRDKLAIDDKTAKDLAASSGGSIGRAVLMHEEAYIQNRDDILNVLLETNKTNLLRLLFFTGDMAAQPKSLTEKLHLMKGCFRDVLVYRETGEQNRLINHDRLDAIKKIGAGLSGRDMLNNIKAVDDALRALEQNANKQLTLEAMMFRLAVK
ncbi:MAG: DNA polymerase III subunit delta' [Deltaproteobacteria bacterium]|nr:DNA polymerase III subunit delta' [Deltaproteobacteria bacterium]